MESILSLVLPYLSRHDVAISMRLSSGVYSVILTILEDNAHWKRRIELNFNITLSDHSIVWRRAYDVLVVKPRREADMKLVSDMQDIETVNVTLEILEKRPYTNVDWKSLLELAGWVNVSTFSRLAANPCYGKFPWLDALQFAAAGGNLDIVQLIYNNLTKIDSGECCHAFNTACKNGRADTVVWMLNDPKTSVNFNVALEAAILSGMIEVVKILLDFPGAQFSNRTLSAACFSEHIEIVILYLERLVSRVMLWREDLSESIYYAALVGNFEVVDLLLGYKCVNPLEGIQAAIKLPTTTMLEHIVSECPDCVPNIGQQLLIEAINTSSVPALKFLLPITSVDPTADDNLLVHKALRYSDHEVLRVLLDDPRMDLSVASDTIARLLDMASREMIEIIQNHPTWPVDLVSPIHSSLPST